MGCLDCIHYFLPHQFYYLFKTDKNIEILKIEKLVKDLKPARGNGFSMISIIIPPHDKISRVIKTLEEEYRCASKINRGSILGAITSAHQRLEQYEDVPRNGLVLYAGTVITDDKKEKKVIIDFEPFKSLKTSIFVCAKKFHTEAHNLLLGSKVE